MRNALLLIAGISLAGACRFDSTGTGDQEDAASPLFDAAVVIFDAPFDAGPMCSNGVRDGTESDVDCGGVCAPCGECLLCNTGADCETGTCSGTFCQPDLSTTTIIGGGTIDAYVRDDGAVLLAHYGPGHRVTNYDQGVSQTADLSGGGIAPAGFAPDPCVASGHLAFSDFDPAGQTVTIECGPDHAAPTVSASSSVLFGDFSDGLKGTYGVAGNPGWGTIAATGSGQGRANYASCGAGTSIVGGGLGYCDGPGGSLFTNHLASFFTRNDAASPFVGCNGTGCEGPTCVLQVWVWIDDF